MNGRSTVRLAVTGRSHHPAPLQLSHTFASRKETSNQIALERQSVCMRVPPESPVSLLPPALAFRRSFALVAADSINPCIAPFVGTA